MAPTRQSRLAALLLAIAIIVTLWAGPAPHVLYRVSFAAASAWGIWRCRRWAYPLALLTAAVWLFVFLRVVPLLVIAPPWVLWFQWSYWLIPSLLVAAVCVLMMPSARRAKRNA